MESLWQAMAVDVDRVRVDAIRSSGERLRADSFDARRGAAGGVAAASGTALRAPKRE